MSFTLRAIASGPALIGLAALALPQAALAEPAVAVTDATDIAPPIAGDILVTARRRSESEQKVPMAISTLSQQILDDREIRTANDLAAAVPGLSGTNIDGPRSSTAFSIRGQGQARGQVSPGVVSYFAEVPDFGTSFFDMQSVQVLKGPQGTLFGRNTNGGAVLFVPVKPTDDLNGHLTTRFGNRSRTDVDFAINAPILPGKVLLRLSGQELKRDGFTRSVVTGDDLDNENKRSLRASLVVKPFEGLENYTIYANERIRENGTGVILAHLRPTSANASYYAQLEAAFLAQQARGPRSNAAPGPNIDDYDSDGVINTTTLDVAKGLSFKNIFSYRSFVVPLSNREQDGTELDALRNSTRAVFRNHSTTEEAQVRGDIGPITAVAGYFYELDDLPLSGQNSVSTQGVYNVYRPFRASRNVSNSFYAQADWAISDTLKLTGGIRHTKEDKRSFNQVAASTVGGAALPFDPPSPIAADQYASYSATTWTAAASYQPIQQLNLYATARRGFKGGGFNGQTVTAASSAYAPEYVTDFEAGAKGLAQIGNWHIRADVDGFYDKYRNIQRSVTTITLPIQSFITNGSKAHMYGFDLDMNISPSRYFSLAAAYTIFIGKYDSYFDPSEGDLSKSQFPYSPKHQWTITPTVTIPTKPGIGTIKLFANIYHQSHSATEPANVANGNATVALVAIASRLPSYTTADLRLDWKSVYGSAFSAGVYVKNVTNNTYPIATGGSYASSSGFSTQVYNIPRLAGVELRVDF